MKKVYSIEGIDCANCAAKLESKINKVKGIDEAVLNFMTSKLTLIFNSEDKKENEKTYEEVKKIIAKMEPDAKIFS